MAFKAWWVAALFWALPGTAAARNPTSDSSADLADPTYLVPAKHLTGETVLGYQETTEDFVLPDGSDSPRRDATADSIDQELDYGLTNRLKLRASISFLAGQRQDTFPTGTLDFGSHGFDDPDFAAIWRAIKQRPGPVSVDLQADYAPDIFQNNSHSVASGAPFYELTARVTRWTPALKLQGFVFGSYRGVRKELDSNGSTTAESSAFELGGGVKAQYRFNPRLYVEGGGSVSQETSVSFANPTQTPYAESF